MRDEAWRKRRKHSLASLQPPEVNSGSYGLPTATCSRPGSRQGHEKLWDISKTVFLRSLMSGSLSTWFFLFFFFLIFRVQLLDASTSRESYSKCVSMDTVGPRDWSSKKRIRRGNR